MRVVRVCAGGCAGVGECDLLVLAQDVQFRGGETQLAVGDRGREGRGGGGWHLGRAMNVTLGGWWVLEGGVGALSGLVGFAVLSCGGRGGAGGMLGVYVRGRWKPVFLCMYVGLHRASELSAVGLLFAGCNVKGGPIIFRRAETLGLS